MALKITDDDFKKESKVTILPKSDDGFNLNQFMMGATKFISSFGNAMSQAGATFEKAKTLREKFKGNKPGIQTPENPIRQPTPPQEIEKALLPGETKTEQTKEVITMSTEDKKEKATKIFNELHGLIKPYIIIAKTMSAGQVIEMAMQPNNKAKIIDEMAKRL